MMLRFRGQLVLLFICLSLIGAQGVVQNGVQDDAQNGAQTGVQSGVQNGAQSVIQDDAQSIAQSINSGVCLLHDPPNPPVISPDSTTCSFRVRTNSAKVTLWGISNFIRDVKDQAIYQYEFGDCAITFKIHNPNPITEEPLLEFLDFNRVPPPPTVPKYKLASKFTLTKDKVSIWDGFNANSLEFSCNPFEQLNSDYADFDFKQFNDVPGSAYTLQFAGVSDSDVTELGLPPAVVQTTTSKNLPQSSEPGVVTTTTSSPLVPSTSSSSSSSSSTSGVVTTTTENPSVLTTTVSSSTSSSTTTTSKPTTTTSKPTTTTSKPSTTTPKPTASSSTTTKATTSSLTSTVLSSTVEPSSGPDQSNLQQEKAASNNKPFKITLFVLLLMAIAALFVILALFGVVFYRMKKGIKSTFIGNKTVTQETI